VLLTATALVRKTSDLGRYAFQMTLITESSPSDWRHLQTAVGDILSECGFAVEVEKTLETVRGDVELDVHGLETVDRRTYSVACECKHWQSRVPKTVVHAFRTVVADLGINSGYIISSSGFQSGAFEACESTNVKLLTWNQFQDEFLHTWLEKYLAPMITESLDPILTYTEPLVPNWFMSVPDSDVEVLRGLRDKYVPFGMMVMMFTTYSRFMRSNAYPELPLRERMTDCLDSIPDAILDAAGYKEFLSLVTQYGQSAIDEFRVVKRRNNA